LPTTEPKSFESAGARDSSTAAPESALSFGVAAFDRAAREQPNVGMQRCLAPEMMELATLSVGRSSAAGAAE